METKQNRHLKNFRRIQSQRRKAAFVFSLAAVLLVVTACNGTFGGSNNQNTLTQADLRKGTDGLVLEFSGNAPPEEVYEESVFPVGVLLKNNGAEDIGEGFLSLGFETAYVDFANRQNSPTTFEVRGKTPFNPKGEEELITLKAQAKRVGSQSEKHPTTIFATACYPYKTILGTSVCVDPDIFGTETRDKACEVKTLEFENGQGAPVVVTKIETRMLPVADQNLVKPHFIIHVENKGNGEVITPKISKIRDACTSESLEYNDFNRIEVFASLSNQQLDCTIGSDGNEARLREKKDVVRCTLEEGIQSTRDAYTSPLRVELDYGYTFTVSKDVTLQKILKY